MATKKSILFLCTGNSCRSQMAEGFAKHLWSNDFDIFSAGTQQHGMNERAIKVMAEAGIDISKHFSKTVGELPVQNFDYVITVCDSAKETCPYFPNGKLIHIGFQDPPALTKEMNNEDEILSIYRRVRDEIRSEIINIKDSL